MVGNSPDILYSLNRLNPRIGVKLVVDIVVIEDQHLDITQSSCGGIGHAEIKLRQCHRAVADFGSVQDQFDDTLECYLP